MKATLLCAAALAGCSMWRPWFSDVHSPAGASDPEEAVRCVSEVVRESDLLIGEEWRVQMRDRDEFVTIRLVERRASPHPSYLYTYEQLVVDVRRGPGGLQFGFQGSAAEVHANLAVGRYQVDIPPGAASRRAIAEIARRCGSTAMERSTATAPPKRIRRPPLETA